MVDRSTRPAVSGWQRLALCASFCASLAACSFDGDLRPKVVTDSSEAVQQRGASNGDTNSYTAVVPRARVPLDALDDEAPEAYTVVRGDTLWDISDRFLKQPWLWPTLWDYNPQIANPHLIYPGDEIALEYIDGKPTLVISRNGQRLPLGAGGGNGRNSGDRTRLSPSIRAESLDRAIPMIPGEAIRQFLVHPQVIAASELAGLPYVVAHHDNRLISAVGHRVYARGLSSRDQTEYSIYRRNKSLRDPVSGELLGYEITHVADARLLNLGDPSTLAISSNQMETIAGDLLLPTGHETPTTVYKPRMPKIRGKGRIVALVNAIAQTGRNQVVVLNLGERSGIQIGDVMAIESRGGSLIDTRGRHSFERITLPDFRTGVVMVFRTFDKVSYALVMESTQPVMRNDIITGL